MNYSYDECEAAMCLWEECLLRRTNDVEDLWDWLRGGEGAANARGMCIDLCQDLEGSYLVARELGFDDSFDWEFVPHWADAAMELSETLYITPQWWPYLAYKAVEAWKHETCRSF